MNKLLYLVLGCSIFLLSFSSLRKRKIKIEGTWKIQTLLRGTDTVSACESMIPTHRFTSKTLGFKGQMKEDSEYIASCARGTFSILYSFRLNITSKVYNNSRVILCLNNDFDIRPMETGTYLFQNDTLNLVEGKMNFIYDSENNTLTNFNPKNNYRLILFKD